MKRMACQVQGKNKKKAKNKNKKAMRINRIT